MTEAPRVAVRPHLGLGRKGVLTVHRITRRGGVDYRGHVRHTAPYAGVILADATMHASLARAINKTTGLPWPRQPCAAVQGRIVGERARRTEGPPRDGREWQRATYSRLKGFRLAADGREFDRAAFAYLWLTKLWVVAPE